MQPEIGKIYEGKVTGITKFGVFVELERGVTGMVHISEVATTFVNEIKEYVKEGDTVKVMVLQTSDDGKISLSIKRALPPEEQERREPRERRPRRDTTERIIYTPKKQAEPQTFEDMMARFKLSSDEKFSDLKRKNGDVKRNSRRGSK